MGVIIALIVASFVTLVYFLCYLWYKSKREAFVRANSLALQALTAINARHFFLQIPCFDMTQNYDNRNYYATISPQDYLTYQLVFHQKDIQQAIDSATENYRRIQSYFAEIGSRCFLGQFDQNIDQQNLSGLDRFLRRHWFTKRFEKLCKIEKDIFDDSLYKPTTSLSITVTLCLTDIQGRRLTYKYSQFSQAQILQIIALLRHKTDGHYTDPEIWNAICRVERGKVSNKMRFAVYQRDNNRCRKCGSTHNLEVDHIYPISKGGKTTFNNLQTLCHRCNTQKSNFIEPGTVNPRTRENYSNPICPFCHIPLVKRRGPHGAFWGCPNYPRCTYTVEST